MTIRRRTKAFEAAMALTDIYPVLCFSENNGFLPVEGLPNARWSVRWEAESFPSARLTRTTAPWRRGTLAGGGERRDVYVLHVHSNLWYEWPVA